MMTIEKVYNGYIVRSSERTQVFGTLEEVFEEALMHFEGLSETFGGKMYGKVTIKRAEGATR